MKRLLRNSLILTTIALIYSCAPKYTAHFNYKPHNNNKQQVASQDIEILVEQIQSREIVEQINSKELIASTTENPATIENPLMGIVETHKARVEEINASGLEGKELKRELKKETKRAKKEVMKEVKEMKKKGDDDYILMMVLAFFIPPLGVGLTYGITNEFWISLVLTLLFVLPGVIYSMVKVHQHFKG